MPSNALGETFTYKSKTGMLNFITQFKTFFLMCAANRNPEDGKVITGPPNFVCKKPKTGRTDNVYLSPPVYNCVGDPYKPRIQSLKRTEDPKGFEKAGHDKVWKQVSHLREKTYVALHEHMNDHVHIEKNYKNEDGKVIVAPRNFYTAAGCSREGKRKMEELFASHPEWVPCKYDNGREAALKERLAGKEKEQEKPFLYRAKTMPKFNTDRAVLGEDVPLPAKTKKPEPKPAVEHEARWKSCRPSRTGHRCGFAPFPEYQPNPMKSVERRKPVEGEEDKKPFCNTKKEFTRPTPSVMTNVRNLKASFPSVFRR